MINVSREFWDEMYAHDNRNFTERVEITLSDSTKLTLQNNDLWNGGITIEDAVSDEDYFDVGAAIINKCTITINNIYDKFSDYDFTDAKVIPYIGLVLPDGTTEEIQKGVFTVDEPKYNGSIITLSCLDNMYKFDRDYAESGLVYPASLSQIIVDACQVCNVTLNTANFPHDDFMVNASPLDDAVTFREVVSWCAQIAGCFARCNTTGALELKWYDQESMEIDILDGGRFSGNTDGYYASDGTVNGGYFNPWNTDGVIDGGGFSELKNVHHIYSNCSMDVSTDDVVITGVRVIEKTDYAEDDYIRTYDAGEAGYVISIENNNLIQNGNGQIVADWLGTQLIGLRFRKASVTHLSDPTIEAGDIAFLTDRKQNTYKILVSYTKFQVGKNQRTTSAAETPAKNSATRYSSETKNYVEYRQNLSKEKTAREEAQAELGERIENSPGLYTTEIEDTAGATTYYMHNKRELAESDIVWRMTAEAWGVSTDGGKTYNAGMTVDGDTIVRILTATGVNADWINAGTLSASRISGGTLTLGGGSNANGIIRILNASGTEVGRWDNSGLNAIAGTIANWTIRNDAFYNGIAYTGTQDSNSTGIGSYGGGWAFWAGNGRFSVTQSGNLTANAGTFNSVTINGAQISSSTLQGTTSNSGTISGGTYSSGNISGGTLSGSTGGSYVGTCSGSKLNSCSLNGTALSLGNGTSYIDSFGTSSGQIYGGDSSRLNANGYYFTLGGLSGLTFTNTDMSITGALSVGGNKNRIIKTNDYGVRCLSAYETPFPTFCDYGIGRLDENGKCWIIIDPIFAETVDKHSIPRVFLTKYGSGDVWVEKIEPSEFLACGTPGMIFSWDARYQQLNISSERMPEFYIQSIKPVNKDFGGDVKKDIEDNTFDYDLSAEDYLICETANSINYAKEGFEYFEKFERSILLA